ncbi:MAG: hypothetical protein GXP32_08865 [Kiritimatiellaeota bacterium]|nr:hypothetical protein [Kiritimatiellota bacterium]
MKFKIAVSTIMTIVSFSALNLKAETDNQIIGEPFTPLFKVGKLNGLPADTEASLVKDEFKLLDFRGNTLKARDPKDFPQILRPGQRVAVFLKIEDETSITRIAASIVKPRDRRAPDPLLELLFNGETLWRGAIADSPTFVSAFIPPGTAADGDAVLQIRNIGATPLAFDWLAVGRAAFMSGDIHFMIDELEALPYASRRHFRCGVVGLDLRRFKKADIAFPRPAEDLKTVSGIPVWSLPPKKRTRLIAELRKILAGVVSKNGQAGKTMKTFEKKFVETLKCGKIPALRVEGASAKTAASLTRLFTRFAGAFVFPDADGADVISDEAGSTVPASDLFIATRDGGSGTAAIYNSSGYSIEPALKVITRMRGRDCSAIPRRGILGRFDFLNRMKLGGGFLIKKAKILIRGLNHWYWSGGSAASLRHVRRGGLFFDDLTGEPTVMFHALNRFAHAVSDQSRRLPCNVVPAIGDERLYDTFWTCAADSDESVTILLTTRRDRGKKAAVTALLPFFGSSACEISTGYAPKGCGKPGFPEIKTRTSTINVTRVGESDQGIARIKAVLSECLTIRIVKSGTRLRSAPVDLGRKTISRSPKFRSGVLKISHHRPESKLIRSSIRWPNGLFGFQGQTKRQAAFGMKEAPPKRGKFKLTSEKWGHPYYAGTRDFPATRATMDGVENAPPWNDKSTLVKIAYPDGKPGKNEGVRLFFGGSRHGIAPESLSFWVRPRLERAKRNPRLRFFLNSRGRNIFLETILKPDSWQRVILPLGKIEAPLWKDICVVGDPKLPEYRKGAMVTFEFNGFCVLSKADNPLHFRCVLQKGTKKNPRKVVWIFIGVPGTIGQRRIEFDHPVRIENLKLLTPLKDENKPKLTYKRAAQILQIDFTFPEIPVKDWEKPVVIPKKLADLLNKDERKFILLDGLTSVALTFELKR